MSNQNGNIEIEIAGDVRVVTGSFMGIGKHQPVKEHDKDNKDKDKTGDDKASDDKDDQDKELQEQAKKKEKQKKKKKAKPGTQHAPHNAAHRLRTARDLLLLSQEQLNEMKPFT
jgi:hypothetical protein